jgi:hypothetical protein
MSRQMVLTIALGSAFIAFTATQVLAAELEMRSITRTIYSPRTELYVEWLPLIVGQESRVTVHLTRTGEHFTPWIEGNVTLTVTVERVSTNAAADAPERPGVFVLTITPTAAGVSRFVIDAVTTTGAEHFVIHNVPVHPDTQAALVNQPDADAGFINYAKEQQFEGDFATAPVVAHFGGAARIVTVPSTAIIQDGVTSHVYVQQTPERFELREVKTRRTIGNMVEVVNGLREGERIVVRGGNSMPRK